MKKRFWILVFLMTIVTGLFAQCFPDRHNTTWYDQWISCETALNPNVERGLSHWILYDFGRKMKVYGLHVWNSNIPGNLDYGMKSVVIDYSDNGETWKEEGTYAFEQATGKTTYEGFDLILSISFKARYVLITALENYGGECFGLSEVAFDMDSVANGVDEVQQECFSAFVFPNPFENQTYLKINADCSGTLSYFVTDLYGHRIVQKTELSAPLHRQLQIDGSRWSAGIYILVLNREGKSKKIKLVKTDNR